MTPGDLTPYQKQNSYYRGIQLSKDVSKQTEVINTSTRALIATQMASANAIITSQERVNDGIENIAYGTERVEQGIYGLQAAFEWGISEVVWQLEQNREMLKSILEVLQAPLDTKARERRKRAERAYANNLIPEAEEEFLESEKLNKFDFTIHISLGMIYLFHNAEKDKALECFEKAIRYAKPESPYHASYSLLYKALILYVNGQIVDAEKCTQKAIELSPDFTEALYQNAQYNAQLRNVQKSIANLTKAIKIDKNYCLKIDKDEMFHPIKSEVNKLFERLKDEVGNSTINLCNNIESGIKEANEIIHNSPTFKNSPFTVQEFNIELTKIHNLMERNSYFDGIDALSVAKDLVKKGQDYIKRAKKYFNDIANQIESDIRNTVKGDHDETNKKREELTNSSGLGCLLWFLLYLATMLLAGLFMQNPAYETLAILIMLIACAIFFGGGRILAKIILKTIGSVIYKNRDLSQFASNKKRGKNEIDKCYKKLSAIVLKQ